jgi:enoyl-CoA hydratase
VTEAAAATPEASTGDASPTVVSRRDGPVGHITLNRPKALNALTVEMVRLIADAFDGWSDDDRVRVVLLDGAGDHAFCAGGDVRVFRDSALSGDPSRSETFWREEYHLNAQIARYSKPVVAIMDRIVMGGGIGLASHASHPVATDRVQAAMPEVGIGFVPDVGATYLLSRAPGELGTHLALTGQMIGAADAVLCGLARFIVPADDVPSLVARLQDGSIPSGAAAAVVPAGELASAREWIDHCYAADSVTTILERLHASANPAARAAADTIETKSPTALAVTLASLRRARDLSSLEQCLDQDFRAACRMLDTADLPEGIRAAVVDKDRTPHWNPPASDRPQTPEVEGYFADLGSRELGLAAAPSPGSSPETTERTSDASRSG